MASFEIDLKTDFQSSMVGFKMVALTYLIALNMIGTLTYFDLISMRMVIFILKRGFICLYYQKKYSVIG